MSSCLERLTPRQRGFARRYKGFVRPWNFLFMKNVTHPTSLSFLDVEGKMHDVKVLFLKQLNSIYRLWVIFGICGLYRVYVYDEYYMLRVEMWSLIP